MKLLTLVCLSVALLAGCDQGPDSPRGFSLPEGNVEQGMQVFIKHRCTACHTLSGIDNQSVDLELEAAVPLGGESARITTYAELVTSIINPSHKISRSYKLNTTDPSGSSKMRNYNDVMTVTELVNLVTFLQPHYKVKPVTYTHYGQYHFP